MSVVMVGTIPLRSILWIAAAEMSDRSPSCWSDRPLSWRRWRIFGPIDSMIWPSWSFRLADADAGVRKATSLLDGRDAPSSIGDAAFIMVNSLEQLSHGEPGERGWRRRS